MTDIQILDGPVVRPASGDRPQSLVVLLHGYASNGEAILSLAPHWQAALPDTLFIDPNAPELCPSTPGGRQWWSLEGLMGSALAHGVRKSAPVLQTFVDGLLAQYGLKEKQLVLVGYSQGTMMALHVGPRRRRQIAGIVGYSGMLADPQSLASEWLSQPPILLIHGGADALLPVRVMQIAEKALSDLGFTVTSYVSPELAHSVDETGLRLGAQFAVNVLKSVENP